jgi:hypothetical protein
MKQERSRAIRRRLGPIGLSLLASALTAAGFAAFSIADSGGGNDSGNGSGTSQTLPAPPPGGARGAIAFAPRLSAEDRQKMEAFHQCMQDNGAPDPPRLDPSQGPPKPPSAEDQQKIQKAYEACKDKLPEDLQNAGPPRFGAQCGPPPGAPAPNQGGGQNQDQSNDSGNQSSGASS